MENLLWVQASLTTLAMLCNGERRKQGAALPWERRRCSTQPCPNPWHCCLQNARARRQGQLAPAAKRELADFNNEACECK